MKNLRELDEYRVKHPIWPQTDKSGAFKVYVNGRSFHVLASVDQIGDGVAWEHVSVTPKNQKWCPTWEEMSEIKDLFFFPDEEAVEFHPKHSEYVNQHEFCLHIWRPADGKLLRSPEDSRSGMETTRDRDAALEEIWKEFGDVPMDPETECIEEPFLGFPAGTNREELWHWFDKRHSKGVAYLLYRDGIDRTDQFSKLVYLKNLCIECESTSCQFNHGGECRFALVHERKPRINTPTGVSTMTTRRVIE